MRQRTIITPAQRLERRQQRKAKEKPVKNYYQLEKYKTLRYDYAEIDDEATRDRMQRAAVIILMCERRAVQDLIGIGEELMTIKAMLPDKFTEWIGEEFGYSNGSAHDFMNMAKRHAQFPKFGNLGISSARLLSAPSVPDGAVLEAIEIAEKEGKITLAATKEIIHHHKPSQPKQLAGPESEPDTIDAEYTVIQSDAGIQLTLTQEMVERLRLACLSRKSLREVMTDKEGSSGMLDRFFILCQRALEAR